MGSPAIIEGVGASHENKLKKAGVGSPARLLAVRQPAARSVANWVKQAGQLPKAVSH